MKNIFLLPALIIGIEASAQIPVTTTALHYVQNFDSLDASGSMQTAMPSGWSFHEWGGSSANATYRAGTGTGTSGDTYSYGATGSSERALGSLCSSGLQNVSFGLRFVNQTSTYINGVSISFRAEQWRRNGSGKTDSTLFFYSTISGSSVDDTSFANWNPVPELLMTSITTALPAAAVNGNDTCARISFQLPLALAPGDTICFRWYDHNAAASDDGLAIDSLQMTFNVGIPPGLFRPRVLNLYPAPGTQDVPPTVVPYIVFDRKITKGSTGAVYIKDRSTQLVQTLTVGASKLYVTGDTAKLYLLNLQSDRTYQIMFDSTTFDTVGFHCMGLYDSTAWTFSTKATRVSASLSASGFGIINPARNGRLMIHCSVSFPQTLRLLIQDMQGRLVCNRQLVVEEGTQVLNEELQLPPGLYLLNLHGKSGFERTKLIVE